MEKLVEQMMPSLHKCDHIQNKRHLLKMFTTEIFYRKNTEQGDFGSSGKNKQLYSRNLAETIQTYC